MPTHLYIPGNPTPTVWERATAHALEVTVSAYNMLIGLIAVVNVNNALVMSRSPLGYLPAPLVYGITLTICIGGALALVGILVKRQNIRREINVEQTGWWITALGWATYGVCATIFVEGAVFASTAGIMIASGAGWRVIALYRIEKMLDAVKEATS